MTSIFLFKQFGRDKFPGIESATIAIRSKLNPDETAETLQAQGILALDIGGGPFDHHGKDHCTTEIVARHLGVDKDPSLSMLLGWVIRDEKFGKGTVSRDRLDRAFGLAGLVASFNKSYPKDPQKVVDLYGAILEGHWIAANQHHVELPQEVAEQKKSGQYEERTAMQGTKKLKVAYVISDKTSMPAYLRSELGGRCDVVVQKAPQTNHVAILTRQPSKVDLAQAAGLIRIREAELSQANLPDDDTYATKTGRVDEVPNWYYDPMTNSILNGGVHSHDVKETVIPWEELKQIVVAGLEA